MRKFSLLVTVLLVSFTALQAQGLDEVLKKHYKASAQEKIEKVTSITTVGKNTISSMGIEMPFTLYQARPLKLRVESEFQGSKVIQTFNGKEGWTYAPGMGFTTPQPLNEEELKMVVKQGTFGSPLWKYEENGNKVSLEGSSDDGKNHKVKLISSAGDESIIMISKETGLIYSVNTVSNIQGTDIEVEVRMKDYKTVKGIPISHFVATSMMGETSMTMTITSVEFNKKLESTLFEKPVI